MRLIIYNVFGDTFQNYAPAMFLININHKRAIISKNLLYLHSKILTLIDINITLIKVTIF
jgi:hypothetical protein